MKFEDESTPKFVGTGSKTQARIALKMNDENRKERGNTLSVICGGYIYNKKAPLG
ncbi:MAG: hypothetical protein QXZ17_14920 [Nitrososphaerota archaeon]